MQALGLFPCRESVKSVLTIFIFYDALHGKDGSRHVSLVFMDPRDSLISLLVPAVLLLVVLLDRCRQGSLCPVESSFQTFSIACPLAYISVLNLWHSLQCNVMQR